MSSPRAGSVALSARVKRREDVLDEELRGGAHQELCQHPAQLLAEAVAVMRDLAGRRQVGFGAPGVAIVRGGESGARDAGSSSTTEGRPGARARRDAGNPG